jgi:hypothetical protein
VLINLNRNFERDSFRLELIKLAFCFGTRVNFKFLGCIVGMNMQQVVFGNENRPIPKDVISLNNGERMESQG